MLKTKIPDLNNHLFLRDSSTGGLSVWLREISNISLQMYKSSKDDIEWMDKERTWILIESSTAKIAICCIYMAVESSTSSPAFKSNQALIEQVVQLEMVDFSSKDYSLLWAGDMNAHVSLEYFPFTKKA